MEWTYENNIVNELPEECVGFVYMIKNTLTGKKYIGKKLAKFSKIKFQTVVQKNGVKKRKKIRLKIDSDWREYWSSSIELKKDVALLGESNFTRTILQYCNSKAECSYVEAKLQFEYKVLESADYYNGHIQVRVHGSHILGKLSK
jgi:hypothetical protein